jgi:hypothetical protein
MMIVGIFSMSIIPVMIAWVLFFNPDWLEGRTNIGQLIIPPVPTERNDFLGVDSFSKDNMKELPGHWIMINLVPNRECGANCKEAIYKTKQMRLMLNKELTRTRRLVIFLADFDIDVVRSLWEKDDRLLRVRPSQKLLDKLLKIRKGTVPEGMLLIMDPLGNLMMQYDPDFDPYDVLKDLKKLFKVSQVG